MNQEEQPRKERILRLNGTILSIVLLAIMAVALVIFVMSNDRSRVIASIALTHTAIALQGTPMPTVTAVGQPAPSPFVNINGILVMGALLVLVALIAVIREALLHRSHRDSP